MHDLLLDNPCGRAYTDPIEQAHGPLPTKDGGIMEKAPLRSISFSELMELEDCHIECTLNYEIKHLPEVVCLFPEDQRGDDR